MNALLASGLAALILSPLAGATVAAARVAEPPAPAPPGSTPAADLFARLPVRFEANLGQHDPRVAFVARAGALTAQLTERALHLSLPGDGVVADLALVFEGARDDVRLRGTRPLPGVLRHYRGDDPARWTRAPSYAGVRYEGLAEGLDLLVHERDGRLAWDLLVAPGADPSEFVVRCEGAFVECVDDAGALVLRTAAGALLQTAPVAWQVAEDGTRLPVRAELLALDATRFGVRVAARDPSLPLVVDPGLAYGGFLGGSLADVARAVAVTPDGRWIVAGQTGSANFPASQGARQPGLSGLTDAFVACVSADGGQLDWATYLGGSDGFVFLSESAQALALDGAGNVYVAGQSNSADFPTTAGTFGEDPPGLSVSVDAFVARLDAGGALSWSTYLGGTGDDYATDLAVDAGGRVHVTGRTFSSNFPTTAGAYDESFNSIFFSDDVFVARLAADATSLEWSTFLGGSLRDEAEALALAADGSVIVAGLSGSSDFPVSVGAYDESFNSGALNDAFIARLSADGSSLTWATFLGGSDRVEVSDIALAADEDVLLAGTSLADDLPTSVGALQPLFAGGASDGFVARLSADGSALDWLTYLGGSGDDELAALALTADEQPTVAGTTTSADLLTSFDAPDASLGGAADAFLARLDVAGAATTHLTYHGGSDEEAGLALALDVHGAARIVGSTRSSDLATTPGAFDQSWNGADDAFLADFDLGPWIDRGGSLAGTGGIVPQLVGGGTLEGGLPYSLVLSDALPSTLCILFLGFASNPVPFKCGELVPFPFAASFSLVTFPDGSVPLFVPDWPVGIPAGTSVFFQWWMADAGAVCGASASNGLQAFTP